DALVLVAQQQLRAILEVAVLDIDERLPEVGQLEQQPILDLLELAGLDFPVAAALVEAEVEELLLAAEIEREVLVDEPDVVVELADLEDLAPPEAEPLVPVLARLQRVALVELFAEPPAVPAILDVAQELDAELVRIQLPRRRREHAGGIVGVIDDLGGLER